MIGIKVCRGSSFPTQCNESDSALNWGPDISDSLLTTEEAARERGIAEINATYTNRKDITVKNATTNFVSPGTFAGLAAETYQIHGIVQSISIQISREGDKMEANSTVQLEGEI